MSQQFDPYRVRVPRPPRPRSRGPSLTVYFVIFVAMLAVLGAALYIMWPQIAPHFGRRAVAKRLRPAAASREAEGNEPQSTDTTKQPDKAKPKIDRSEFPNAPPRAEPPINSATARRIQQEWAKYLGVPVEKTNSIGMKFVLIPPGEFDMGAGDDEIVAQLKGAEARGEPGAVQNLIKSQGPRHRVRISRPFWLAARETTQAEYSRLMSANPSMHSAQGRRGKEVGGQDTSVFPVESVSWLDADEFCRRLSLLQDERVDRRFYRLPSESEWEFACRAGAKGENFFGDNAAELRDYAWYGENSENRPHPAGGKRANPWGLFDVLGNVGEWCADGHGVYPADFQIDPLGRLASGSHSTRGGNFAWRNYVNGTFRRAIAPHLSSGDVGFRVVAEIPQSGQRPKFARVKIEEIGLPGMPTPAEVVEFGAVWMDRLQPAERPRDLQWNRSCDGNALQVAGKVYPRGLGGRATNEMIFPLLGRYARFEAECGVDDETGGDETCTFRVVADGQTIFDSGPMRRGEPAKPISVDVRNKKELRLIADAGGQAAGSHADWSVARLITLDESVAAASPFNPNAPPDSPAGKEKPKPGAPVATTGQPYPRAMPEEAAVAKAAEAVRQKYKSEKAATSEARSALAKKVLEEGGKIDNDDAARCAQMRAALDMAADATDLGTATAAITALAQSFRDVDALVLKQELFVNLSKKAKTVTGHERLSQRAAELAEEAMAADRLDHSVELVKFARSEAQKSRDKEAFQKLQNRQKELEAAEKMMPEVKAAREKLKQDEKDAEANLVVGRYTCFIKGDWDTGLPLLALGSDPALKDVAKREADGGPEKADGQRQLGDGWWDMAEATQQPAYKKRMMLRSAEWYYQAFPYAAGGLKAKLEKRILTGGLVARYVNAIDGGTMVLIPGGRVPFAEEKFPVTLPPFYIGLHEVSVAQYLRFIQAAGHRPPRQWEKQILHPDYPVVHVSWNDAVGYCRWAGLRLPSELEWERGARGSDARSYPWGDKWNPTKAATSRETRLVPVLSHPEGASPWGLLHCSGNVAEWCADWAEQRRYDRYRRGDLMAPPAGDFRLICGGAFGAEPEWRKCTSRSQAAQDFDGDADCGFRVARSITVTPGS